MWLITDDETKLQSQKIDVVFVDNIRKRVRLCLTFRHSECDAFNRPPAMSADYRLPPLAKTATHAARSLCDS